LNTIVFVSQGFTTHDFEQIFPAGATATMVKWSTGSL
jgi:hypothetical protein